jgi:hypothetical protein
LVHHVTNSLLKVKIVLFVIRVNFFE